MAPKDLNVLEVEPPDLWQRYIDPEFRDQASQGRRRGDLAALEELEVPLGFHEGAGSQLRQVGE